MVRLSALRLPVFLEADLKKLFRSCFVVTQNSDAAAPRERIFFRPRDSGGGGPRQRVRPEVAGPMTSSAWWRGRRRLSLIGVDGIHRRGPRPSHRAARGPPSPLSRGGMNNAIRVRPPGALI